MLATRQIIRPMILLCMCAVINGATAEEKRVHIQIRGIYGGVPVELLNVETDSKSLWLAIRVELRSDHLVESIGLNDPRIAGAAVVKDADQELCQVIDT